MRANVNDMMRYNLVKEITKAVRKLGIDAYSYGYCCNTDYFDGKVEPEGDYIGAKVYRGGLNNNFHKDRNGKTFVDMSGNLYFHWSLSEENLMKTLVAIQKVIEGYGNVIRPKDEGSCIRVEWIG